MKEQLSLQQVEELIKDKKPVDFAVAKKFFTTLKFNVENFEQMPEEQIKALGKLCYEYALNEANDKEKRRIAKYNFTNPLTEAFNLVPAAEAPKA